MILNHKFYKCYYRHIGGTAIQITQNRRYDLLNSSIQTMTLPETNITYALRPTSKSVHGTETEFEKQQLR